MTKREVKIFIILPILLAVWIVVIAFALAIPSSITTLPRYFISWMVAIFLVAVIFISLAILIRAVMDYIIDEHFD
jgi:hypothetical protein